MNRWPFFYYPRGFFWRFERCRFIDLNIVVFFYDFFNVLLFIFIFWQASNDIEYLFVFFIYLLVGILVYYHDKWGSTIV